VLFVPSELDHNSDSGFNLIGKVIRDTVSESSSYCKRQNNISKTIIRHINKQNVKKKINKERGKLLNA
jgi:hypothetical protein